MNELIIIKHLILNKELYDKYYQFLNQDYLRTTFKELTRVLNLIEERYYNNQLFTSVLDFQVLFFDKYPSLKKADVMYYHALFEKMDKLQVSHETLEELLEGHRKRSIAFNVAEKAWEIANGTREFNELPEALQQVSNADNYSIKQPEIEFVSTDIDVLYNTTYGLPGFKWKLKTLRAMMGSLRKGDFGFIFARPEAGKTTFIADQIGYMAGQCERGVAHFNNEEFGNKLMLRYIQAAFGIGVRDLFRSKAEYQHKFRDNVGSKIKIIDRSTLNKREIEDILEIVKPNIIVFDSIDKIDGFEDDRDDLKYKKIYAWARELSKEYGPVIGVCHASASGEGKKYLEMDDVAYAKTAKQGEADWILGIGKSHDPIDEKRRFLHLCKNKQMGDEDFDEELRHGRLPVRLYADIAQYDDELEFDNKEE